MHTMLLLFAAAGLVAPAEPQHVTGGQPADACVFPTTVAVKTPGGLCTGTLVHPSLVVYAAHCGADDPAIVLGQHQLAGAVDAVVERCETNPDYLGASDPAHDWAYCLLAQPIPLPVTPPLYGCETEAIVADATVWIAGFGYTSPGVGDCSKNWAQTTIISTFGSTATIGGDGASTCPGDSGGSAFIRLDDGGWRAISMVSAGVDCTSATHALMHPAVPWIEERSGLDITPCHDVDGTWNPGPDCGGFYAGDTDETASWDALCDGLTVTAPAATCGESYAESEGSTGEVDEVDEGSSSGDVPDPTTGEVTGTSAGDESSGGAPESTEDSANGGGCRTGGTAPTWLLLLTLGVWRRRGSR